MCLDTTVKKTGSCAQIWALEPWEGRGALSARPAGSRLPGQTRGKRYNLTGGTGGWGLHL